MNTIFINLFGGPGTGKSTICASVFHKLKVMGIECEMALEYAKDVVWEESYKKLDNQIYIFGKQHYRIWRLSGKVQVVITDSPLLNSIVYDKTNNPLLRDLIVYEFKNLNTLNYYIDRDVDYNPNGRMQTAEEALEVDSSYLDILEKYSILHSRIPKGEVGVEIIVNQIINKIEEQTK